MAQIEAGDIVYVQHDPRKGVEVWNEAWPDAEQHPVKVYTKRPGESGFVEHGGSVKRVTVSSETIEVTTGSQRVRARHSKESARGMAHGIVVEVGTA